MLDGVVLDYDLDRFPFPTMVTAHVGYDLGRLHEKYAYAQLARGNEQHTPLHGLLYAIGPEFRSLYREFLDAVIRPAVGVDGDLIFQRIPNFRFQLPGNIAVRGYHRDREDGHQPAEINVWVPLTPVDESTAVWVEPWVGAGQHRPRPAQPGQALVFDGANLEHGNVENISGRTRVSFDFRVARRAQFVDSAERSMYRQVAFSIGEYFDVLPTIAGGASGC